MVYNNLQLYIKDNLHNWYIILCSKNMFYGNKYKLMIKYNMYVYYKRPTNIMIWHFQESVDAENIRGFEAVQNIVRYLLQFRDPDVCMTNQQADEVVRLWNALSAFDKHRTYFPARHREKLKTGRYRHSKAAYSAPGADSVRRLKHLA